MGVKSPGCSEGTQGSSCGLVPSGALGFCRIQGMERSCAPAKGSVSAWGEDPGHGEGQCSSQGTCECLG